MAGEQMRSGCLLSHVVRDAGLIDSDGTVVVVSRLSWWTGWLRHSAPTTALGLLGATALILLDLSKERNPFPLLALGGGTAMVWAIWVTRQRRRTDEVWLARKQVRRLLSVCGAAEALTEWSPATRGVERYRAQLLVAGQGGVGLAVDQGVQWFRERGVSVVVCCTPGGYVRDCTLVSRDGRSVTLFATGRLGAGSPPAE